MASFTLDNVACLIDIIVIGVGKYCNGPNGPNGGTSGEFTHTPHKGGGYVTSIDEVEQSSIAPPVVIVSR